MPELEKGQLDKEQYIPPQETGESRDQVETPSVPETEAQQLNAPEELVMVPDATVASELPPVPLPPGDIPREFNSPEGAKQWVNDIIEKSNQNLDVNSSGDVENKLIALHKYKNQQIPPETK